MNFTYSVQRGPDGAWGALMEDGTWSGMIGELMTGGVDMR